MRNLQIRTLDRNNPEELPNFFDSLDYSHAPHWSGCYCRYYHNNCTNQKWFNRDSMTNRLESISAIQSGEMNGFLIYDQDKPIGWLNAQAASNFIRLSSEINSFSDKKFALSICFVIHPDYRNQGIATQLLDYAIEYFKQKEFNGMLALPPTEVCDIQKAYRGVLSMYLKRGYKKVSENDGVSTLILEF
jgi:GNAT superfamily N-acetyltransferase